MVVISPLDFETIFVTILAGSPAVFLFISLLFISGLSAYFRINGSIMLILYLLFGIIFISYIGAFWVLICIVAGILIFYSLSRWFNR